MDIEYDKIPESYKKVAELLWKKSWTPYRLAKEAGISQSSLSSWMHGRGVPRYETLKKIADVLDVSVDHLLGYEHDYKKFHETVEQSPNKTDAENGAMVLDLRTQGNNKEWVTMAEPEILSYLSTLTPDEKKTVKELAALDEKTRKDLMVIIDLFLKQKDDSK